jgi:hypothetical protein
VERTEVDGRTSYTHTECGRELNDVVQALSVWGVRWIGALGDKDLDPHFLMWDIRRNVPVDEWPRARTVLGFRLSGVAAKSSSWWLVVADGKADICDLDPGHEVIATVSTSLLTLTQIWRGDVSWPRALLDGSVKIDGPADARRAVPRWLGQSSSAAVPRPA